MISEDKGAPAAFDEVWHLTKPASGKGGWVVAGIQQNG
jgi:predicted lipid-binding transport protein (Tim44 family)